MSGRRIARLDSKVGFQGRIPRSDSKVCLSTKNLGVACLALGTRRNLRFNRLSRIPLELVAHEVAHLGIESALRGQLSDERVEVLPGLPHESRTPPVGITASTNINTGGAPVRRTRTSLRAWHALPLSQPVVGGAAVIPSMSPITTLNGACP